ncbi:M13 family metallopeptidase [Parablastomonas sp. CN1-191]|uniref:M13 family metallopeptidase n=1 Tax=Parablastomonas sp. CN1-191 TaxID=3400908 RepID=UPI003BF80B96
MTTKTFFAAMLLGATALAGPIACKMPAGETAVAPAAGTALGFDPARMDKTVKPGDDFYAFANGTWQKDTAIPADRSSISSSFQSQQATEANLKSLVDGLVASTPAAGTNEARIKDYYTAFMDTAGIDAAGLKPAQADLDRFAAIADVKGLSTVLGQQLRADLDPLNATAMSTENLFGAFVTQSLKGTAVMPYLLQGGLGMPEREYYLSSDAKMAGLRDQYKAYIAKFLTDAGIPDAQAKAQRIYDLEMKIAQAHMTRDESDDWIHRNQEWSLADFKTKAPGMDWDAFFAASQLGGQQTFAAYHDGAIPKLSALVASQPLDAWKDWLAFHQLNSHAEVLPAKLRDDHFAFYGTALQGTTQPLAREKRVLGAESSAPYANHVSLGDVMGQAVGKLYVDKFFPASSKAAITQMVTNIKNAFAHRVEGITTLAPATKEEALKKVENIVVGVGYPDKWDDYSALTIDPHNAYADAVNGEKARYQRQLAKLGKPLDRGEWWMNPQLVNAVNLPVQNALNFPAAILQKPDFDPAADPAANYGATGATIGHEISHSFDNGGAMFDASGKMRNWWTDADLAAFDKSGKALAAQYDSYSPFPGYHVNGNLTLGENIADVVGLQAAYDAYRASLNGKEAPVIDGYSGDQRFFIAFAQSWATKMRDELMRNRLATDGHAPGMYRAQTVRNIDAWYKAFNVQPGDKLYLAPESRVKVWG